MQELRAVMWRTQLQQGARLDVKVQLEKLKKKKNAFFLRNKTLKKNYVVVLNYLMKLVYCWT